MGYGKQTEHTTGGLSDTFQTISRQSDFRPNHMWVLCDFPNNKILNAIAIVTMHICTITVTTVVHLCTILHPLIWVFF